jgi:RING-finger-containing ubiquitin ligase
MEHDEISSITYYLAFGLTLFLFIVGLSQLLTYIFSVSGDFEFTGLTDIDFAKLKERGKETLSKLNLMQKSICPICLLDFTASMGMIQLPKCKHCYHEKCLLGWIKEHVTCPYCRTNIQQDLLHAS